MQVQDTARIPLRARDGSIRAYTLVDAADAAFVNQWTWRLASNGYVARSQKIDGRLVTFMLHRELMGLTTGDGLEVDHRNHDTLDNRRANLRKVTPSVHRQFVRAIGGSSRYRGVGWDAGRQQWTAKVQIGGKTYNLGRYETEREAAAAARAGRIILMPHAPDTDTD